MSSRLLFLTLSAFLWFAHVRINESAQAHTATAGSAAEVGDGVGLSPSVDLSPSAGPFMSQGALPGSPSLERVRREPAHVTNDFLTANAQAAQDLFDFITSSQEVGRPPAWTRGYYLFILEQHSCWT
jgi:hypothetical protein